MVPKDGKARSRMYIWGGASCCRGVLYRVQEQFTQHGVRGS